MSQQNLNPNLLGPMHFGGHDGLTNGGGQGGFSLNLASASQEAMKRTSAEAGLGSVGLDRDSESDSDGSSLPKELMQNAVKPGKKTKGRVKIKMEFIENKLRRYTTFSKRKTGIMKKAYELSTLTGTQVMLLVASETGHVYTFATRKLQPMITSESGKALIQTCLNSPDPPSTPSGTQSVDQRMNPTGFEETDLSYAVMDEDGSSMEQPTPTPKAVFPNVNSTPPHSANQLMDSPIPSPQSSMTSQQAMASQSNQTISMTAYLPPTNTSNGGQTKASNISMQLPAGGIILPSGGLPPGTPITLSALQQAALQQSAGQQAVYRIPTGSGQMLAIPAVTGVTTTSSSSTSTSSSSNSSQNGNSALSAVQNVAVMAGSALQQPTTGAAAGTVVYQTPQGMVYASPTTATVNALPEGYILSLPQTPTFSMTGDQPPGQQQFITIPVSLANSQMLQPVLAQTAGEATELLRSLEKRSK